METALTKQRIISELARSTHGDLKEYLPTAAQAIKEDPHFFAHLIAWNHKKGEIRDAKIALPVASLHAANFEFTENSLAHLASLDPRNFLRAWRFAKDIKTPKHGRELRRLVQSYLYARESNYNWWMRTVIQHRNSMKALYAIFHIQPTPPFEEILFKGLRPPGSPLEAIANLKDMKPTLAAAAIAQHRIPFLVAVGALGGKAKDTDMVMAIIDQMSASELISNTKMLEKLGVREVPALRAAYEAGLQRVAVSKKNTLKTTKAAQVVSDEVLKDKLIAAQEKQLKAIAVEGNWLVLGDRSSSMQVSIEASRHIASTLAKMVKGEVHLIFFNNSPLYYNVAGKTYDEVLTLTKNVTASGGTSIGCGLDYALNKQLDLQGIAIVSDGGENGTPYFFDMYNRYMAKMGNEPAIYFYKVRGSDGDTFTGHMKSARLDMQTFDLTSGVDYYSLPNVVATMRAGKYSLLDEIMEMPLLTLDKVFNQESEEQNVAA